MAKTIELTKGQFATVDDEDYDRLMTHSWCAIQCRKGGNFVATRGTQIGKKKITVYMHREVYGSASEIDHKDGNPLNNQKNNLRPCTRAENQRNKKIRKDSTTGRKGISVYFSGYRARIKVNKIWHHLGCYADIDLAAHAYNKAAIRLHGEFACINPIGVDPRA